jgi:YD repeat-containing protein
MHGSVVRRIVACSLLAITFMAAVSAQTVRYIYDELGRLVAVIDPNGDAAIYNYDAVGNLLSIVRQTAGTVAILEFTPNGGTIGATVKLFGTGFSATPSQNTVTFNGTAATVTSSTTTEIVTSVPSSATTGTIAVTTPSGSATSATAFTVSASAAPTISSCGSRRTP